MANKTQWISVVAASALAASFTFTGCGSSSSTPPPPPGSSSSSAASSSVGPVMIKVSDAYVLNANVTAGSATAIEVGNGDYEFNASVSGQIDSMGGANDVAAPLGQATSADPKAPDMSAPAGYTNINPYTTMMVNGVADLNNTYPAAAAEPGTSGLQFNYDVVAAGSVDNNGTGNLAIAQETAMAALTLSGYPGDGQGSSSSMTSSSSVASSSSSTANNPFPAAARECVEVFPGDCDVASSSSSEASSSSAASSTPSGGTAFADIGNCTTNACVDAIVATEMTILNGAYGDTGSSSSAPMSSSSSVMSSSSSSNANNPFPAPQQ